MNKYILISFIALLSCNQIKKERNNDYKLQAQVWTQNSAEYRALCYQAFNAAKMNLDAIFFFEKKHDKPLAIIADVDET